MPPFVLLPAVGGAHRISYFKEGNGCGFGYYLFQGSIVGQAGINEAIGKFDHHCEHREP